MASGYTRGCGIAPLVTEGATRDSDDVAEATRRKASAPLGSRTDAQVAC
ncbi:hypothetical protein ABH920_003785 [Catenulispora sp. EB89]